MISRGALDLLDGTPIVVMVHDLQVPGVAVAPYEADPPLVIDAHAPWAIAVTRELLQAVAWR